MKALFDRITPLQLRDPIPSKSQLDIAIAAAQAAPDHGRLRPWRFIVIEGDARQKFGDLMAQALQVRDPAATAEQLEKEAAKPLRAPLIVVIACAEQVSPKAPMEEQIMAVSAAAQNFQLALHDMGFGCQWKSGVAARDAVVKQGLGLALADSIVAIMYIGTIEKAGPERSPVLDASKVVYWG